MATEDTSLLKGGGVRVFIQKDGISPANSYLYYGCLSLDGPTKDLGEPDPVYCPSSVQRNAWDIVDTIPKTPALGTTDFTQHMSKNLSDVWWELKEKRCQFNVQAVLDSCGRPDDFNTWEAKILLNTTRLTSLTLGALNPLSGDDNAVVDITGSLTYNDFVRILPIKFGEQAASTVVAEIVDVLYSDVLQCGDCGTPSDGCTRAYALAVSNTGSPGLSAQVVHRNAAGAWATVDIACLGGLTANRFAMVGNRLVVVSEAFRGHAHETQAQVDANTQAWTCSTAGYVAAKGPRAIHSKSPSETFIAGAGGYIYLMTSPTAAVTTLTDGSVSAQNLNDIHGLGRVVVAVGNSNAVLFSANAGRTFSLVVGPTVGVNLTAVYVYSERVWFVGTGNGQLWFTLDQGATWSRITLDSDVTIVNDIRFDNTTVGYLAVQAGAAGRIYRTTDGGNSWFNDQPSLTGLPTAERYNAVWPCGANKVLAGGRVSAGGDGVLAEAA